MINKSPLLIDVLSPEGHSKFNNEVERYFNSTIIYLKNEDRRLFKDILNHLKSLFVKGQVILVSFNTFYLSLFLPFIFFRRSKLTAVVHNNLDFGAVSNGHLFFLRILSNFVNFIFIADYITIRASELRIKGTTVDFLFLGFRRDLELNLLQKSNVQFSSCAFVHGRTSLQSIKSARVDWNEFNTVFCNNSKIALDLYKNWECDFFPDLDVILESCSDFFFLEVENYRQYSVFYLILKKEGIKIWITDLLFFEYACNVVKTYNLDVNVQLLEYN